MLIKSYQQILLGLLIGIFAGLPVAFYLFIHREQIAPAIENAVKGQLLSAATVRKREIAGFFPYWNLDKADEVDLSQLTTVYYFAIDLNADGSLNDADPGLPRLHSTEARLLREKITRNGGRWGLTIINLSQDSIAKNINSSLRQNNIVSNTVKLMKAERATALNIDLEYVGDPDPELKKSFTVFIQKLTSTVHQEIPGSVVSFDAFADSVKKPRIFDLAAIGKIVDHIIIMGYDFHRLGSLKAGPVAPLFGKEKFGYDVATSVHDYKQIIPSDKIVLGVPFYGYEWPTQTDEKESFVINSSRGPEISSYSRSLETAAANKVAVNFDDESKSVWFPYFDNTFRTWRQVWFENQRSLGLKFDLVNESNLGGIAIFALGYDGRDAAPLWDEVRLKFK